MSAHVVVIDSTARRAVIKTNPSKPLADILQEACGKLGLNASQYGLKHKSKQVDLSLIFRLSGLSSGAKLELVQLSKSPSVVTVALQLPESEAQGAPNGRLLDKFPSTTTLWFVLRKFEAGVAGNGSTRNLTARAAPATDSGTNGTGRLYYQIPVLQVMGRELANFSDLQKSLAQLGFNSGNVLFRLSFRTTQQPFEDAVTTISQYFKASEEEEESSSATAEAVAVPSAPAQERGPEPEPEQTAQDTTQTVAAPEASTSPLPASEEIPPETQQEARPEAQSEAQSEAQTEAATALSVSERPVTVYKPPTNTTPQSALATYREQDYVPSIEHAKTHQERLNQLSQNVRLPSDKELADKAAAEQEKLAAITETEIKVRFPDQSQVVAKFKKADTGSSLHAFVRGCLNAPFVNEKFSLVVFGAPTTTAAAAAAAKQARTGGPRLAIPDSDRQYLINDLGLRGRVLANFTWADSSNSSSTTTTILKPELRTQAQDIQIPSVPGIVEEEAEKTPSATSNIPKKDGGGRKSGGVPKWLKLPGKK